VGIIVGTYAAYSVINPVTKAHFGGSIAPAPLLGTPVYIGITAFVLNLLVAAVLTLILRAVKVTEGRDITTASDYGADEDDPKVAAIEARASEEEPPVTQPSV
jgi:solute:Na+ symporter, SSS family